MTIPEVLIALLILTLGMLGLGASGLYVSAMLARGERVGTATTFAARRLELIRAGACLPTPPADGTEQFTRGGAVLAANTWSTTAADRGVIRLRVVSTYLLAPRRARADTLESGVVCP